MNPVGLLGGNGQLTSYRYRRDSGTPVPYRAGSTDLARFNGQGLGYAQYHSPVPKIYQWNFSA